MMSLNLVETNDEDEDYDRVFELRFEVDFEIGEIVYLKTDIEQKPRMVTGYRVDSLGVVYMLNQSTAYTEHNSIEISRDIDRLITSTN